MSWPRIWTSTRTGTAAPTARTPNWNSGAGWAPIGGAFSADFDGGGHTISNLFISTSNSGNVGLFSQINQGVTSAKPIRNLGLANVSVMGGASVGGLVRFLRQGAVKSVYVSGAVTTGGDYAG